jgi:hypothetical protein
VKGDLILTWCNQYTQKKDKRKALFAKRTHKERTSTWYQKNKLTQLNAARPKTFGFVKFSAQKLLFKNFL